MMTVYRRGQITSPMARLLLEHGRVSWSEYVAVQEHANALTRAEMGVSLTSGG